ncbi:acyltransferase [Catellatospora citrea]|uniref:acyltransferase family protein n=1 Tax=Catellatospora citrea TaxID=53366 RepID=UPI0033C49914
MDSDIATRSALPAGTTTAPDPRPAADSPVAADAPAGQRELRLSGLDGIRGLAALFVVLHHCYLASYPGYPRTTGPWWSGWLIYGHFAVVVFIVLSGFSLAVSPARRGWNLGDKRVFAQRRAWRILPPYWAALAYSLFVAWVVVPEDGVHPTAKSVLVHGLLLQDVFESVSPNGAFWSIAVEAQLYLVFPLMLLLVRRVGTAVMLGAVTVVVVAQGVLAAHVSVVDLFSRFTPQFAALFAAGVVAAGVLRDRERAARLPYGWLSLLAALPVVGLIAYQGSEWTVANLFWVDLALGPAAALLLAAIASGRLRTLTRLLDLAPIRRLGTFSYSLYLVHAPILAIVFVKLVEPHTAPGAGRFLLTLGTVTPLAVAFAWCFAQVFELPFQRYRSWAALWQALPGRRVRS